MSSVLVLFENTPHVVVRKVDDYGVQVLDLASPPRRRILERGWWSRRGGR